jgi:hypothetical protein
VVVDSVPAGDACFHRFSDLPSELQCYTLSFLPARVLVRDVARTSRRMKCIIDAYVQRRINAALGVSANKTAKGKDKFEDEPCTLMVSNGSQISHTSLIKGFTVVRSPTSNRHAHLTSSFVLLAHGVCR